MNKSVIVLGLGKFGYTVASKLFEQGIEVMAVDKDYSLVQSISNHVNAAVQCDFLDEEAMAELGISNFDIAIISTGTSLEASIAATMLASDANVSKIIAKAKSANQARILRKLGADQIIYPEIDMGERLARSITGSNLLEFIHFSDEYGLIEASAKDSWIGKDLGKLNFRNHYHMNVVAIRRRGEYIITPGSKEKIEKGDVLILIGEEKYVKEVEN